MQQVTSKTGSWQTLQKHCESIRLAVFVKEQNVSPSIEIDGRDNQCHHFVVFNETNNPVATARLANNGKFGRMAVLKDYRGQGIGNELLRLILQQAAILNLEQLVCHAQLSATEFYAKNGFIRMGKPMEEAGIGHIKMVKTINAAEDTLQ